MEEDEILTSYLNEEEMGKLIHSLEVYLQHIESLDRARIAPIVNENLTELMLYLPYIHTYYEGFDKLLAKVLALLKRIEEKEKDEATLRIVREAISTIEEHFPSLPYQKYYQQYGYYGYYYPTTSKQRAEYKKKQYQKALNELQKYLLEHDESLRQPTPLQIAVSEEIAATSGFLDPSAKDAFRGIYVPGSWDEAAIEACKRIVDEIKAKEEWKKQKAELDEKYKQLELSKEELKKLKKKLLNKAVDDIIQNYWRDSS